MRRKPVHLEFDGNLAINMPTEAQALIDALFDPDTDLPWSHSGMAYALAEKMNLTDCEELLRCFGEEIKRRQE